MKENTASDRIVRFANRIDWIAAILCLAWAAYASSLAWGIAGGVFLLTAWINPVARMRKSMARKLIKK